MTHGRDDLAELKRRLGDRVEDLAVELFGTPTKRTKRELRFNAKGSLQVRLDGKSGPTFKSYEAEAGGSLLDAIMFRRECSLAQAIAWARAWLGDDSTRPAPLPPRRQTRAFDADRDEAERIANAGALWRAGRDPHGTAACRYLVGRAITRWPLEAVRYIGARDVSRITGWRWWRWSAVMFPATLAAGDVRAVQMVALNDDGTPARDDDGGKIKRTRGAMAETAVRFAGDDGDALLLCEGPETALSLWLATGATTWANLGSITKAPLAGVDRGRTIVACRDDDPRDAPSRKGLRDTLARWRREGRRVLDATPWPLSRGDKSDFNDVLQADGVEAVGVRIAAATTTRTMPAGDHLVKAQRRLAGEIAASVEDLLAWRPIEENDPAPFHVIGATLGLGKSEEGLRRALDAIVAGHRVVYAAPTHKLTGELQARAEAIAAKKGIALTVRVWRGHDRPDPERPGEKMCRDLEAFEAAESARLLPTETVCKVCPHRDDCAYLAQRQAQAELWLVATALLWGALPKAMAGTSLAIVDEAFALDGLTGFDGPPALFSLDELEAVPMHGSGGVALTADLAAELRPLRRKLRAGLEGHPLDALERDRLRTAGLSADDARQARKLEWRRKVKVEPRPGMTRAELLTALRAARDNRAVERAASLWHAVETVLADDGPARSGRAVLVDHTDDNTDATYRAVRLFGARDRGAGWKKLPTLHLDATADLALIRERVPHAELRANVVAATPHMTVRQVVGRTFGKRQMGHNDKALREAWRYAVAHATRAGGRWLVVTHKAAEEAIRTRCAVPDFLELAHFGDVAGRDEWRDVRGVVILGRPLPGPAIVERMAGAISGRAVEPVRANGKGGAWYPAAAVNLEARDGTVRTVEADRHPDPLAEAVRGQICERELVQAIGRGRGASRSAANPLEVMVLNNVPLPLEADTLADWQAPTLEDEMLADHGAVLATHADAAKLVGISPVAVEHRRRRENPLRAGIGSSYTGAAGVSAVYRRAGARGPAGRMAYDRRRITNPRAWLESRLGALSDFEMVGGLQPPDGDALSPPIGERPEFSGALKGLYAHVRAPAPEPVSYFRANLAAPSHGMPAELAEAMLSRIQEKAPVEAVVPFSSIMEKEAGPPAALFRSTLDKPPQSLGAGMPAESWLSVSTEKGVLGGNISGEARAREALSAMMLSANYGNGSAWADYAGGVMPAELRAHVRDRLRDSGLRQEEFAARVGISRPQIANALAGRFGLSPDVAARLVATVAALPSRQASMGLLL